MIQGQSPGIQALVAALLRSNSAESLAHRFGSAFSAGLKRYYLLFFVLFFFVLFLPILFLFFIVLRDFLFLLPPFRLEL